MTTDRTTTATDRRRPARRVPAFLRRLTAGCAAVAVLLAPLAVGHADNEGTKIVDEIDAAPADPIHSELREFFLTGKYILYISQKAQNAKIYHSRGAGAFLVLGSDFGRALLIEPKTRTVSALPEEKVARRPDGGMDVVADAPIEKLGSFSLSRGDVVISAPELKARLRPQPYLIGLKTGEELILHTPEYERDGSSYRPNATAIRSLRGATQPVVMRVYFGSWCHTCSRLLPRILKVEKALEGTNIRFEYYGLPKGARAMARDPLARRYGIKRIPTGLVSVDGRSAGRIDSTQFAKPEAALLELLR